MAYIGGEPEPGCLFCRLLEDPSRDEENLVVWRPAGAIVVLNKFPYNSGHLMVAPVRHTGDLADLEPTETADVMTAVQESLRLVREAMGPDGFNVGANLGRAAKNVGPAARPMLRASVQPSAPETKFTSFGS